ncbi:acetyl-CoA carboxylase subunit beta [candidate division WOR-1 bacterium RIFOXYB2_FULL_42_35]|uniref:Acetyl-coenzyme A carboxylase carboxyl transferase subunit beta n=1 Tax=candidate division WOR-1 bacterium RIFOXYC2_FULL_41_25 TaxID=1802586 RepID=A0A1F4TIK3_UNCSA|nr:MAG: acetyl-CoA carboxylase subunit beta [candidate division WOR-1 bacterium RIFOXYA2_FULL_41_14]OGC21577.1 MAG: acetyl-CoA carboxylase subunit beta [candidate division WOR-1 bacterium RIFOXYB2_FULL_42_35]OGC32555.1 MAG: acetyl-CoA carboxylase subunit beta [candidate division WOR-1 bacterium RIFOXYC2_FULL_41_25]OGC42227.1 MAG: acetyl-CoA carboxylase subunit beta [candidate division WOR-1 bacterium RIFOXYD2_FULL_41_8]
MHNWFKRKKAQQETAYVRERLDIPGNLWVKCYKCNQAIFTKDLEDNLKVCPKCSYHFKLTAAERIIQITDPNSFKEINQKIVSKDFLNFTDSKSYAQRIEKSILKSNLYDAIVTGLAKISNLPVALGIMDFSFMGGSMGSVVGEKIARLIELALEKKAPVIIFSSSGGARMQEGIMSLMQMAKTSAALGRLRENSLPYISVMTDPTTGGTSASFAMLGDVNMAEPDALIGFAGPRVIEQTIRQKLPPGFQRSEYVQEHGMIDVVCDRRQLRENLSKFLRWFDER